MLGSVPDFIYTLVRKLNDRWYRRGSARDVRQSQLVRRTTGGSLVRRRRQASEDESDDVSEDHSRRRRQDGRDRSDRGAAQQRRHGPLEHFLRETGAGLGATVGRGLDTLVREGKKEVTDFFLR